MISASRSAELMRRERGESGNLWAQYLSTADSVQTANGLRTEVQRPVGATGALRARSAPTPQRPPRRTPPRGGAPAGSEPTGPDSERQGQTSASEEGRRSEHAGEGRLSDPLLWADR